MRDVYIRGLVALLWIILAITRAISGNFKTAIFYVLIGGVFLYSTYQMLKRSKGNKSS